MVVGVLVALTVIVTMPPSNAADDGVPEVEVGLVSSYGLGMSNYQTQNSANFLAGGRTVFMRHSCHPLMVDSAEGWAVQTKDLEGLPAVFSGCGTGPASQKYGSGHMSGKRGKGDAFFHGSAATPTVEGYRKWLHEVKTVVGNRVDRWEVWNEGDSPQFFRGTPQDLVDLTFVAAEVWGRERVIAPSFTPAAFNGSNMLSGGWDKNGKRLTRLEFATQFWQQLVFEAEQRGVELPVSAAVVHGYGSGATVREAVASRNKVLATFAALVASTGLPLWDTEWNLRSTGADPFDAGVGFPDTKNSVEGWVDSVKTAHCLGYVRQYAYLWTDQPTLTGFEVGQLQFNQTTDNINEAFRTLVNVENPVCPVPNSVGGKHFVDRNPVGEQFSS